MTIANFVDRYKIHLDSEGQARIPYIARTPEETRFVQNFCRDNRQEILDYLGNQKQKENFRKVLEATVRKKVFDVMLAWENYLYEMTKFNATGMTTKPSAPEIGLDEAVSSLNEQELAVYKALLFARSTDIDKAHCGELAIEDIAAATHGYDTILTRMKQDYEEIVYRRRREGERAAQYRRYMTLMNEMHPHPEQSYEADYNYGEMIG